MKRIRTNKITACCEFEKILADFEVFKITTTEKYLRYGSMVLDYASCSLKARSVVFEGGKSFYCLFDRGRQDLTSFAMNIKNSEGGDSLMVEKVASISQLKLIPEHLLIQLLLNSLAAPNNEYLAYNNVGGSLMCIPPEIFKRQAGSAKHLFKIPALKINIDRQMMLQLDLKTFSSLSIKSKLGLNKPLKEYPQYTIVYSTRSFRRVLPSEKFELKDKYILKQEEGKKSSISFLNLKDPDSFFNSKSGLLYSFLKEVDKKLSPYIKLAVSQISPEQSLRFDKLVSVEKSDAIKKLISQKGIHIVDLVKDEESIDSIEQLRKSLYEYYPELLVTVGRRSKRSSLNLILVHNADFYNRYGGTDPYGSRSPGIMSQHITIEDFNTSSKAVLDNAIKELCIKHDLSAGRITLTNWQVLRFHSKWIFGQRFGDKFLFMEIFPNGSFEFNLLEIPSVIESEFQKYADDYLEFESKKGNPEVEGIIISGNGESNLICKTARYTLPDFQTIGRAFEEVAQPLRISKEDFLSHFIQFMQGKDNSALKEYLCTLQDLLQEEFTREDILGIIRHRTIRKDFTQFFNERTGFLLRTYFKDADTRYEILDSNLDIKYYTQDSSGYYFVGTKGEGIQSNFPYASMIRRIVPIGESRLLFHEILPTMKVDFVRNQNLTVLPFPFKYLRERAFI